MVALVSFFVVTSILLPSSRPHRSSRVYSFHPRYVFIAWALPPPRMRAFSSQVCSFPLRHVLALFSDLRRHGCVTRVWIWMDRLLNHLEPEWQRIGSYDHVMIICGSVFIVCGRGVILTDRRSTAGRATVDRRFVRISPRPQTMTPDPHMIIT